MLEKLNNLDGQITLWFDRHHTPFFDFVFYWTSDKWIWIPFYLLLLILVFRDHRKQSRLIVLSIVVLVMLTDQFSSGIVKELVQRLRPCQDPVIGPQLHLVNGECGGLYGFISSHAANTFGVSYFLNRIFRKNYPKLANALPVWAAFVSFSRVYLGAHYLSDIICGGLSGVLIAMVVYRMYQKLYLKGVLIAK